jgi:hypothetical protein
MPRLPVITVGPVFEIADPARTAKLRAVPSLGWVAANADAGQTPAKTAVIRIGIETEMIRERLTTAKLWAGRKNKSSNRLMSEPPLGEIVSPGLDNLETGRAAERGGTVPASRRTCVYISIMPNRQMADGKVIS